MSTVGIILRVARDGDIAAAKAELSQFMLQRLPVHIQNLGRASHVSLSVLETATDVTTLKFTPVFSEIGRKWHPQAVGFSLTALGNAVQGDACRNLVRQIFRRDLIAVGHD